MSKNTRWALAIVGVVIIIVGAFVIGTGKDNTDAVQEPAQQTTAETGATEPSEATPETGSTGSTAKSGGDDSGSKNDSDSGGASPDDSGQDSGGAKPGAAAPKESSGGAGANIGSSDVVSPILTAEKVRTVNASKGDVVTIRAFSNSNGEVHVHGYDKEYLLKEGKVTRFKFKASIDGEFAIEFHLPDGSHADVGTLRVSP
ncbi:MAG: hypothetical protein ACRDKE_11335 [Solirubrobacterales bacterium]